MVSLNAFRIPILFVSFSGSNQILTNIDETFLILFTFILLTTFTFSAYQISLDSRKPIVTKYSIFFTKLLLILPCEWSTI